MSRSFNEVVEEFADKDFDGHFTAMVNSDHGNPETGHRNPYHLEGSVWTHTAMVTSVAKEIHSDDFCFQVATLFHDIGKPLMRQIRDNGRVAFFNHENMSVFIALRMMNYMDSLASLTKEEKIRILSIINLHGDFYSLAGASDAKKVVKLSERFVRKADLFIDVMDHVHCDHAGRFCRDEGRTFSEEIICEVLDRINTSERNHDVYDRFTDRSVTLMIGPPGSGKSTWLEPNFEDEHTKVISRDQVIMDMAEAETKKKTTYSEAWHIVDQGAVTHKTRDDFTTATFDPGVSVILDMTNVSRKSRRQWLSNLPHFIKKKAVVFLTDREELMKRNKVRSKTEGKDIPTDVMDRMMSQFMIPLHDEFDDIDWLFN
jgi:predicted kinase